MCVFGRWCLRVLAEQLKLDLWVKACTPLDDSACAAFPTAPSCASETARRRFISRCVRALVRACVRSHAALSAAANSSYMSPFSQASTRSNMVATLELRRR